MRGVTKEHEKRLWVMESLVFLTVMPVYVCTRMSQLNNLYTLNLSSMLYERKGREGERKKEKRKKGRKENERRKEKEKSKTRSSEIAFLIY